MVCLYACRLNNFTGTKYSSPLGLYFLGFCILSEKIKWVLEVLPGDTEVVFSDMMSGSLLWLQNSVQSIEDYIISHSVPLTTQIVQESWREERKNVNNVIYYYEEILV